MATRASRDIEPAAASVLVWNPDDVSGSASQIRAYVEAEAAKAIAWYMRHKRSKQRVSLGLRFATIVLTAAAGLLPLFGGFLPSELAVLSDGKTTSLCIGLAASFVGADKAFGYSSGWIRYMTTAGSIRRALEEFRMTWTQKIAAAGRELTAKEVLELLEVAKGFRLVVEDQVAAETQAWIAEFQNSLAHLERDARAQAAAERAASQALADAQRPGSLELTVPEVAAADDQRLAVLLRDATGATVADETAVGPVWMHLQLPPGRYALSISAAFARKPRKNGSIVEIAPGSVQRLTLRLPQDATAPA